MYFDAESVASTLFSSRFEEILFWVAVIFSFALPGIFFTRWSRQNAASVERKPVNDLSNLTNFALIPAAAIAIVVGYARVGALPHWLFYPGLALFVLGLALTVWAYHTLGRFFSLEVQIQNDHNIVDSGPYRVLRHPGYAGVAFGFLGLGIALQSWVSVLVLLLATTAAFAYRVHVEEKFLVDELGDDYVRYMAKTKRIIPYVW
jgi:protein-S-isoprenylcysteine O-methyltransferase Ste14